MLGAVVVAAADAGRRRQQSFVDVIAHRAPRHAAKCGEVADAVARVAVDHEPDNATVDVTLSTVTLSRASTVAAKYSQHHARPQIRD